VILVLPNLQIRIVNCKVDVGTSPACRNHRQQCLSCDSRFDELMDQLSKLMIAYGKLVEDITELKCLVATPGIPQRACLIPATDQSSSINQTTITTRTDPGVPASVHAEFAEVQRRKCNIVVSGLPNSVSVDDDCGLFLKICEENLPVKPVIVRDKCRQLGKPSGDKPQPFLVVFSNEQAAVDTLQVARQLRQSDDEYVKHNVFFNHDLTKAEAELAYQKRVARRRRNESHSTDRPLCPTVLHLLLPQNSQRLLSHSFVIWLTHHQLLPLQLCQWVVEVCPALRRLLLIK